MSSVKDYVPSNAAQFNAFVQNLTGYVSEKMSSWGHIPAQPLENLTSRYAVFSGAHEAALGPHTPVQTLARQEAQKECVRALRAFVNQYLRFPPVTNVDRAEMGIPNRDTVRTERTDVTETVDFSVRLKGIRELVVDFKVSGAAHKAKPAGYDGAVIIWGLTDKMPGNPSELPYHTLASRTPSVISFEEADRGKTAVIALAWQNERGKTGPWSEYKKAIVP